MTTTNTDLDAAIAKLTAAFPTFADLVAAAREFGYQPTIRVERFRGARRRAALAIRRAMHQAMLATYPTYGYYREEQ